MSSNEQAFVKAFSRRSRVVGKKPTTAPSAASPDASTVAPQQITRVDQPQTIGNTPLIQSASEAQSGVDPAEQQRLAALGPKNTPQDASAAVAATMNTGRFSPPQPAQPPIDRPIGVPEQASHGPATERFDPQSCGPPTPHHRVVQQPARAPAEPQQAAARSIEPFQAVWEVDVFDVPSRVAGLFFDGKRYQQIAERMSAAVSTGLQSVLVTSSGSGEGRSSVAIGIAMAAAASGIRVALVDADTENPTLADELRLELQFGWVDTVRGGLPIKEIAVHAVEDGVTLIPLMPPNGQTAATAYEVTQLVQSLTSKFDLLVIDGPCCATSHVFQMATAVDTSIIVRDVARTDDSKIQQISKRMCEAGVQGVGVVENFA